MSVRATHDHAVALYDSVTGLAFGPVFEDESQADEFIDWLTTDPRSYSSEQLAAKFLQFKADGLYQLAGGAAGRTDADIVNALQAAYDEEQELADMESDYDAGYLSGIERAINIVQTLAHGLTPAVTPDDDDEPPYADDGFNEQLAAS